MNENEKNPPEDMDSALQALLGDISSETPPSQEDPEAVPEAAPMEIPEADAVATPKIQPTTPPAATPEVIPAELKPLPLAANPDSPFHPAEEEYPEPSAVDAPPNPRHRFMANPIARKRRRWPWILLLLVILGASGGAYYFRATRSHHEGPSEILAELPPELELPPMDAAFLPPEEPSEPPPAEPSKHSEPDVHAAKTPPRAPPVEAPQHHPEPAPAVPSKHGEPEVLAAKVPPNHHAPHQFDAPEPDVKVIAPPVPAIRAMDSATLSHLEGSMNSNKVHYRFDLVLFSREMGLRTKLPPFEEAIRAVAGNIFYFTVPGKAMLPELEQQVLQKAGFLFPDGRLIRVEVRNLELEPVKR